MKLENVLLQTSLERRGYTPRHWKGPSTAMSVSRDETGITFWSYGTPVIHLHKNFLIQDPRNYSSTTSKHKSIFMNDILDALGQLLPYTGDSFPVQLDYGDVVYVRRLNVLNTYRLKPEMEQHPRLKNAFRPTLSREQTDALLPRDWFSGWKPGYPIDWWCYRLPKKAREVARAAQPHAAYRFVHPIVMLSDTYSPGVFLYSEANWNRFQACRDDKEVLAFILTLPSRAANRMSRERLLKFYDFYMEHGPMLRDMGGSKALPEVFRSL